jgi:hypothetical protein
MTLDSDFKRRANVAVYQRELARSHPQWEFLKALGFTETAPGQIETPSFPLLLENLITKVDDLNARLKEMGGDVKIRPELYIDLEGRSETKQKVILKPLQQFSAPGFSLVPKSNILSPEAFAATTAHGGFPVGGIENASPPGVTRVIMDLPDYIQQPVLVDFLHDLAHLGAFSRHPEFAQSYVRVFRQIDSRARRLPEDEQQKYLYSALGIPGSKNWFRHFLFSEGSWITRPNYQKKLEGWPTIRKLMNFRNKAEEKNIASTLSQHEKEQLLKELREIQSQWWQLFDPLGGATNDMVSTYGFDAKSQFPIHAVLLELDHYLTIVDPLNATDQSTISLVLGVLQHSEELSIKRWEYFARKDSREPSETLRVFKKMFPKATLENNQTWSGLHEFLYGR